MTRVCCTVRLCKTQVAVKSLLEAIKMKTPVTRQTADLSAYPDLVVIYLGMRVKAVGGIKTLLGFGPKIDKAGMDRPDGL